VAQAKALWRWSVAHQGAPKTLTLCTDASANHHRTAIALADQWAEVLGTHVNIVELEWSVYLATRAAPGDCDLVRLGWSADFADAEAFAAIFESGHPQNTLGYSSARYDALLGRSRLTGDAAARGRLLSEAERVVLEDVPVIPIFHRVAKRLVKPRVTGYAANPLGHLPSRDLSVDR
jgi:oligopeptide transport system substrate-binding protein